MSWRFLLFSSDCIPCVLCTHLHRWLETVKYLEYYWKDPKVWEQDDSPTHNLSKSGTLRSELGSRGLEAVLRIRYNFFRIRILPRYAFYCWAIKHNYAIFLTYLKTSITPKIKEKKMQQKLYFSQYYIMKKLNYTGSVCGLRIRVSEKDYIRNTDRKLSSNICNEKSGKYFSLSVWSILIIESI